MQGMNINSKSVLAIKSDEFAAMQERTELMIGEMRTQNQGLTEALQNSKADMEWLQTQFADKQAAMQKLAAERGDNGGTPLLDLLSEAVPYLDIAARLGARAFSSAFRR
mmetsp:Transcript_61065/g.160563  ORF Transcript_61065/g.160563 Transcript_61065/m.160563 type:complete len:109 (-) Transcript_61065:37-363(-)